MKKQILLCVAALVLVGCGHKNSEPSSIDNSSDDATSESVQETSNSVNASSESSQSQSSAVGERGTLTNPYSIAEALQIIGTNTSFSTKMIYIKGIVREKPYYNDKYKSYSSYLIDDTGSTDNVQVYSGTIDANAGYSDIKEGDTVVAGGYYTYFQKNSQPELAGNSDGVTYPIYYQIIRGGASVPTTYETKEDNGKETVTTTIEFTEDNAKTMSGINDKNGNYLWTNGIVSMEYDAGTQYSFTQYTDPFRFYVGTYLHIRVSSGKIKYLQFNTNNNYPFTGDEPVTNGKTEVESDAKTYVFAKTGTNYIKIHNSNKGEVKNVLIKQKRFYSLTVVSYK